MAHVEMYVIVVSHQFVGHIKSFVGRAPTLSAVLWYSFYFHTVDMEEVVDMIACSQGGTKVNDGRIWCFGSNPCTS